MPFPTIVKKVFGSRNERLLKKYRAQVKLINAFEQQIEQLSDEQLKANTVELRALWQKDKNLDTLLPKAFAVVREMARRKLNMRHFDVQLIGGIALNEGKIAEMHTGEGKTLVATLPAYLNTLTGGSVHIVTVNDYLAQRDSDWMRPLFESLGLSVGVILSGMSKEEKQAAYSCDIVYGTNNEYGFDYLRDNMAPRLDEKVQSDLSFAIVDEVDSILIDEARTPLIISGAAEESSDLYNKIDGIIPQLVRQQEENGEGDYFVDEKQKQVTFTEAGHEKVEQLLIKQSLLPANESLYASNNIILMHHLDSALKAHKLFQKDVDYIVKDNEVIIVDEHTGRTMPGRRWSEGLHQAVEAKEKVTVNSENQTLASITFQNYFRLYNKLSGMTGTADTEAYEFQQIYGLEVVVIPSNKPNQRQDKNDLVFLSNKGKYQKIIDDVKACLKRKQPVLLGTASIESSELLATLLKNEKITHKVLNAKFHASEAQIIEQAGKPGAVTIATNMAGRGTDIVLGGNVAAQIEQLKNPTEDKAKALMTQWKEDHAQVIAAGGLHVICAERHESRRIDNQLRGRAGRQGDPGATQFYLSLEDNLMRIFASPNLVKMMHKLHTDEMEPLEHSTLTKTIENAQRKVEGRNFDIRKQLLEYDDVANEQRIIVYEQRAYIMKTQDLTQYAEEVIHQAAEQLFRSYVPENAVDELWQITELEEQLQREFSLNISFNTDLKESEQSDEQLLDKLQNTALDVFKEKSKQVESDVLQEWIQSIILQSLDQRWKEHLAGMDHLRQSIHLRGYAQKDPKQEYKREAFTMFSDMIEQLKYDIAQVLLTTEFDLVTQAQAEGAQLPELDDSKLEFQHQEAANILAPSEEGASVENQATGLVKERKGETFVRKSPKIGRNNPCHCGSGKKFKHCCGQLN